MTEHLSNGQFARKEITEGTASSEKSAPERKKGKPRGRPFQKGNPGKPKGTLNKLTRDVKQFLDDLVTDVDVQEAVRDRLKKGDTVGFFRALENAIGKPTERHEHKGDVRLVIKWEGE